MHGNSSNLLHRSRVGNDIIIINYRNDETGIPWDRTDDQFLDAMDQLGEQHGKEFKIAGTLKFGSEGEYGPVQDFANPQAILSEAGSAITPSVQAWLDSRRKAFERLLDEYSQPIPEVTRRRKLRSIPLAHLASRKFCPIAYSQLNF